MKHNVIAKLNAAGVTMFYVDGKRVSREQAATVYQDAAAEKFFACTDAFDRSCSGKCHIQIRGYHTLPVVDSTNKNVTVSFTIWAGADSILNGLKLAAIATTIPDIRRARIYLACGDGDTWEHDADYILVGTGGVWVDNTNCRLYRELLDELAAQDFQPVLNYKTLEAKWHALQAERLEITKREHDAHSEAWRAQDACDTAVEAYLQSFIA